MDQNFSLIAEANKFIVARQTELNGEQPESSQPENAQLQAAKKSPTIARGPIHPKMNHPEACRKIPIVLPPYRLP